MTLDIADGEFVCLVVPSGNHGGTERTITPEAWTPGDGPPCRPSVEEYCH